MEDKLKCKHKYARKGYLYFVASKDEDPVK